MRRIALAALAAAVTVIPCRMHAQDASYTQKRQQLVKELESTQSALQQLRGERLQLAARIENVLAQVMEQRAQQLLLSNEQSSLRQMDSLLTESETALNAGKTVNAEAVDKNLGIIKQYRPRVASMRKAYCK